jgi:nucleoside-diphosphate-sugar epimerase
VAAADPQADLRSNVLPMLGLLETCRQQSLAPVVLFAGTATQVGLPSLLPVNESQPDQPVTIYDLHKLAAENYLKHYISQGYVRGASLRLANVYGPGPHSSSSDRGVLNAMIRRALAGEPLTVYGAGEFVRDYVFVGDVVRAFLLAGAAPDAVNGRHFVIGSGQGHTLAEAFKLVAQRAAIRTGRQTAVEYTNPVAPISLIEQRHFVADIGEFRRATGWTPEKNLVSGIDSTIEAWQ